MPAVTASKAGATVETRPLPSTRTVTAWFVWMLFTVVVFALALAHDVRAEQPGPSFDPVAAQQVLDSVPGNTVAVYCAGDHSSCWLEVEVVTVDGDDDGNGVIHEDESGWRCATMGNRVCGPGARP